MVGHTGVYEKGIIAVETADKCIEKLINNIDLSEYTIIITADHGNCEEMINEDDTVNTAHTTNLVPVVITDENIKIRDGILSDVAPTLLELLSVEVPADMSSKSIIVK